MQGRGSRIHRHGVGGAGEAREPGLKILDLGAGGDPSGTQRFGDGSDIFFADLGNMKGQKGFSHAKPSDKFAEPVAFRRSSSLNVNQ